MNIRPYQVTDRKAVENIHFQTGFLGKTMNKWLSNNKLWRHHIAYYLRNEPEGIFVLENHKRKIVGYVLGTYDDKKTSGKAHFVFRTISNSIQSVFLPRKDRLFWSSQMKSLILTALGKSGEKDFCTPYPAGHLHINLLPEARGKGFGTKLLKKFESYAKKHGCKELHADSFLTKLNNNVNFWNKNGFKVFDKVPTSLWSYQLPQEKIFLVCYTKKI